MRAAVRLKPGNGDLSTYRTKTMHSLLTYRGVKYSKQDLQEAVVKHAEGLSHSETPLVYRRINYRPQITVTKTK